MKRIFLSFMAIIAVLLFFGCNNQNNSYGTVKFTIDKKLASQITASATTRGTRTIPDDLFIDINLVGFFESQKPEDDLEHQHYNVIQTIPVEEGATAFFDDVPVGITIFVDAFAYQIIELEDPEIPVSDDFYSPYYENNKNVLFRGTVYDFLIHEGENNLELILKKLFDVNYYNDDGTLLFTKRITKGDFAYTPEPNPTKETSTTSEYEFAGWYIDSDYSELFDFATPITQNINLYAKYTEKTASQFSITITVSPTSDIEVTPSTPATSASIRIFTADEGYDSYTWKIDDEIYSATGGAYSTTNILTVDTTGWEAGTYDVTLIASKNGESYSFFAQIIISQN